MKMQVWYNYRMWINCTCFEEALGVVSFRGLKVLSGSQIGSHSLTLSEPITAGHRNAFKALKQVCSKSDFKML